MSVKIENETYLDFDDVLIKPKSSPLPNRSHISLYRNFTFTNTRRGLCCVPIMAANMDTTGTFEIAQVLCKRKWITCLRKHYHLTQLHEFYDTLEDQQKDLVWYSMGVKDEEIQKLRDFIKFGYTPNVCVDVANGYTDYFVDQVKKIRDVIGVYGILMAGNVATYDLVDRILRHSNADIVKVGIGPGCFAAGTRVLMSNGTYKNIEHISVGDYVINKNGESVRVKRAWCTGFKTCVAIKHTNWYKPTLVTEDHKYLIGDLSSISHNTLLSRGYAYHLNKKDRTQNTKIKWARIDTNKTHCYLYPRNIKFKFNEEFQFDYKEGVCEPTYNLGYILGTFLGDGNVSFSNKSGSCHWTFGLNEEKIAKKLELAINHTFNKKCTINYNHNTIRIYCCYTRLAEILKTFGKKNNKHLPSKYMSYNTEYLNGIYDGLIDSDGYYSKDGRECFTNTSHYLIELFGILSLILNKSFPNMLLNKKTTGNLKSANIDNCNESFVARLNVSHKKRHLVKNYNIAKKTSYKTLSNILLPVYDIEVECPTHSFIADNVIVHNSNCTTRIVTGIGIPQLSAVMQCSDAAHGSQNGFICSDGGCKYSGDIVKAFGADADFVMLGSLLVGVNESYGAWSYNNSHLCHGQYVDVLNAFPDIEYADKTKLTFTHYGMSSYIAKEKNGGGGERRASEGKISYVNYKGSLEDVCNQIEGGLASGCSMIGAAKIKDVGKCTTFIRVNQTHNTRFSGKEEFKI